MMPFIVGFTFEKSQLTELVRPYWDTIEACLYPEMERASNHMWPKVQIPSEIGKVKFITIQESRVKTGTTQRRPGLHVDSTGKVKIKNEESETFNEGDGSSRPYRDHPWGDGCAHRGQDDVVIFRGGVIRNGWFS